MLKKIVVGLSLVLWPLNFFLNFDSLRFSGDSVFKNDYQGEQLVLRNIQLYPTPLFARVFQNKPRIYFNKYVSNFFALTDPNSYFFGLHPSPIAGNQNLFKYPFVAIIFFLIGLFYIGKSKHKKFTLWLLLPSIFILSSLTSFEGFDIILWLPVSLLIINGVNELEKRNKKMFIAVSILFLIFAVPEIIRSLIK